MRGTGLEDASAGFLHRVDLAALEEGARNLLLGCAELRPGQRVVVLHEDPGLGWYDLAAPKAVARLARELGADVTLAEVGGPGTFLPASARSAIAKADVEIWFARIGDQDRFAARDPRRVTVVSYARTAEELASTFGSRPHRDMVALKHRIDEILANAGSMEVRCPLGTWLHSREQGAVPDDVSVRRFPMCVPRPVRADTFTGRVALARFLCPTGSRSYTPASVMLPQAVLAHVEEGRVVGYEGDPETIRLIQQHYDHVSSLFGISPEVVHSWHPGIHSGCADDLDPARDPDRWANSVFGSPRWLHFHTCGDYAPGEICWMVENPTVMVDGQVVWDHGRLALEALHTGPSA